MIAAAAAAAAVAACARRMRPLSPHLAVRVLHQQPEGLHAAVHLVVPRKVGRDGEVDAQQAARERLHVRRQLQARELVHKLVLRAGAARGGRRQRGWWVGWWVGCGVAGQARRERSRGEQPDARVHRAGDAAPTQARLPKAVALAVGDGKGCRPGHHAATNAAANSPAHAQPAPQHLSMHSGIESHAATWPCERDIHRRGCISSSHGQAMACARAAAPAVRSIAAPWQVRSRLNESRRRRLPVARAMTHTAGAALHWHSATCSHCAPPRKTCTRAQSTTTCHHLAVCE